MCIYLVAWFWHGCGMHGCSWLFRCSVFLLDKESEELVAKVFDGDVSEAVEGTKYCEVNERPVHKALSNSLVKTHSRDCQE